MPKIKRTSELMFALAVLALSPTLQADHKPATMMFGGKEFYIGMSKAEAGRLLSACCNVRPPLDQNIEATSTKLPGGYAGHSILSKDSLHILGFIAFTNGRVARVGRDLSDDFSETADDVIAFARVLKRTLASHTGEGPTGALVAVQKQDMSGGESDAIFIKFPDGHEIQIELTTTDKPMAGKRDWVSLSESLGEPIK